jgi:predicted homoserine dehydrogenase-like protein
LKRAVAKDSVVSYDDVELVSDMDVVDLRRGMEKDFAIH